MGRRRPDAVFLPGKFVFPGGRVEAGDGDVAFAGSLSEHERGCLLRGVRDTNPERGMRAFAAAALRETFEETGYLVAMAGGEPAGHVEGDWERVLRSGLMPDFSQVNYVARAITPPGRARRYDTRFFLAEASAVYTVRPRTDGELSEIGWFGLDHLADHDLPSITRMVLQDLRKVLAGGPASEIPFYFWRSGAFRRAVLKGRGHAA
jgi:8-oxo-dGTP pyrophosphatase MutT (NUDIX family)